MHFLTTLFRPRRVRAAVASLLWVACPAFAVRAQTPSPSPTPKFDMVDSPIGADELARELGYKFYGNTWKFSVPTYVRVRQWSADGSAAEVPARPPKDAQWSDVYSPDQPQSELTIHVLEKEEDKNTAADGSSDYTRISLSFKINASGKDAPGGAPPGAAPSTPGIVSMKLTTSGGAGTSVTLGLMEGPRQGFNTQWLYATGNLGIVFQGIGKAIGEAIIHPDRPGQQEAAEATIRNDAEAGMRAAPLNVCYFKGEVCGQGDTEQQKAAPGSHNVPKKRAVFLVTLECSLEPFKADAAVTTPPTGAQVASGR